MKMYFFKFRIHSIHILFMHIVHSNTIQSTHSQTEESNSYLWLADFIISSKSENYIISIITPSSRAKNNRLTNHDHQQMNLALSLHLIHTLRPACDSV